MTDEIDKLTLVLHRPPFKVSALSALFRSLQAAVREIAAAGEPTENLFSAAEGPFLVTEVDASDDGSLTFEMWFVDRDNLPLRERTAEAFDRALSELERELVNVSQHTFWGAPAYRSGPHASDNRMLRFITVLRTFRFATVTYRRRSVELRHGTFAVERI